MFLFSEKQAVLVENIAKILISKKETVGVAESSSGGLISALLLSFPGASQYYMGGGVLYSYAIRDSLIGMSEKDHEQYGKGTPEVISELSKRFLNKTPGITWCIGEAGAAGPLGSPYGYPAGHSVVAVSGPICRTKVIETGAADRVANMIQFSTEALELFYQVLKDNM